MDPSTYEDLRLAQLARLRAHEAAHPLVYVPEVDVEHPDAFHDPDDPAEAHLAAGSWPPPTMGAGS